MTKTEKNVYSLVLLDDVVDAVDHLAYERGTSRSNTINRILAEYLSCPLPENRIHTIFDDMEQAFSSLSNFQVNPSPGETMLSIRSALRYRYNPSIRYALELFQQCEEEIGELRVSLRSQNQSLIQLLTEFFSFWNDMENKWVGPLFPEGRVPAEVEPGRYTRRLRMPPEQEEQDCGKIADAIFDYITEFDSALKKYFADADAGQEPRRELEQEYRDFLNRTIVL